MPLEEKVLCPAFMLLGQTFITSWASVDIAQGTGIAVTGEVGVGGVESR